MDWMQAEKHLKMVIGWYEEIGPAGMPGLMITLYPLRRRLEAGDRTQELYDAIMACE